MTIYAPSIPKLEPLFGNNAKKAREIIRAEKTLAIWSDECEAVKALRAQPLHPSKMLVKMTYLNALCHGFGVESLATEHTDEHADYINMGDPYVKTIIFWRGLYRLQSVGNFVENVRVKFK